MATEVPEDLRKQLALAVRNIHWSYAFFWSISTTQSGVLEWGEGYYNGDIKTRKTVQAVELNADELGLQRSDQLRELYESLHLGETNPQAKRPTAALSPEDLTDAEWYFLVCMSFTFNIGQGLPGRTFAKNQTLWLCNAHRTDTKVFSRSLLAKSASIQTIVCFPHLGGVVELGSTELVQEDLNLIQHIKTSFLGSPATVSTILNHVSNNITNNNDLIREVLEQANMPENFLNPGQDCPDLDICSPITNSDDFADNLLIEESEMVGIDGEIITNCLNNSMNSSDCVSQTNGNPENFLPISDGNNKAIDSFIHGTQECNQQILDSEHVHYQSVLSNLLKSSNQLILGPYFRNGSRESSFVSWKKEALSGANVLSRTGTPQKLLKKVLFQVAKMHENARLESSKRNGKKDSKPENEEVDRAHVLSERKRREKINERYAILGSLVPSGGKVDKVSILDHTIEYLRELEKKVEKLQSQQESTTQSKPHDDSIERTSDNYGPDSNNVKKPLTNKRKACDVDKTVAGSSRGRLKNLSMTDNINVKITDKIVLIEISCSWRESVLLEVIEAISKLHLDSETVQSSNVDGLLSLTIKAKCKGLKLAPASVIKQALQKIIKKS